MHTGFWFLAIYLSCILAWLVIKSEKIKKSLHLFQHSYYLLVIIFFKKIIFYWVSPCDKNVLALLFNKSFVQLFFILCCLIIVATEKSDFAKDITLMKKIDPVFLKAGFLFFNTSLVTQIKLSLRRSPDSYRDHRLVHYSTKPEVF